VTRADGSVTVGPALPAADAGFSPKKLLQLLGISALYLVLVTLPTPAGLTPAAQKALALMVAAVLTWVLEVIPIGIASVLFVFLQGPLGIYPLGEAVTNFSTPTIFFIMAMFLIATAFEESGLGRRLSLWLASLAGSNPRYVLLSFMLPTAILSMVLADIPTAVMFASIALGLLERTGCLPGKSNFGRAVMMGIPIAASIGGIGTPAGSGINVMALGLLKDTAHVNVNFLQWSALGIPLVLILTPIAWLILTWVVPFEIKEVSGLDKVRADLRRLGPLSAGEKRFVGIFAMTIVLWFTEPFHRIPAPFVAVATAALFFAPGVNLLNWKEASGRIGWDVILLVGAANSLALSLWKLGAAKWLATGILGGLGHTTLLTLVLIIAAFGVFSHLLIPVATGLLAVMIPALAVLAAGMGVNPAALVIPIAFTASCVFLLPLDPIPLVTYPYGYYKMLDMFKPGVLIALVWIVLLAFLIVGATGAGLI